MRMDSRTIHQSVLNHLESLHEVQALLRHSTLALRTGLGPALAIRALDALCGTLEDIRLEARQRRDARHRGVLLVLYAEAETLFVQELGDKHRWLRLNRHGNWHVRAARLRTIAAEDLAFELEAFVEGHLRPFLKSWGRPVCTTLAV